MATFKPIAVNRDGVVLPYQEGQFIIASRSFTDGRNSYPHGVYVDMQGSRSLIIQNDATGKPGPQGPPGADGPKGDTGEAGAPGADGKTGGIQCIGTMTPNGAYIHIHTSYNPRGDVNPNDTILTDDGDLYQYIGTDILTDLSQGIPNAKLLLLGSFGSNVVVDSEVTAKGQNAVSGKAVFEYVNKVVSGIQVTGNIDVRNDYY